jgi:hypothetical protein
MIYQTQYFNMVIKNIKTFKIFFLKMYFVCLQYMESVKIVMNENKNNKMNKKY